MPLITNFSDLDRLLGKKGSDRTRSVSSATRSAGDVAARTVEKVPGFSLGEAASAPPSPADPEEFSAERMRGPYAGNLNGRERNGFVLTSDLWLERNTVLSLHAGPSSTNWSLALRAMDEEIQSGHARYAQARTVGATQESTTYFDVPRLDMTFQSGNILPIPRRFVDGGGAKIAPGLEDFYAFMSLLNQPPLIPSGANEGKHNYTWIFYTSLMYPRIVLKGYFDPQGVSWADTADSPAGFTWQATFVAHEATPTPWNLDEVQAAYADFEFTLF